MVKNNVGKHNLTENNSRLSSEFIYCYGIGYNNRKLSSNKLKRSHDDYYGHIDICGMYIFLALVFLIIFVLLSISQLYSNFLRVLVCQLSS